MTTDRRARATTHPRREALAAADGGVHLAVSHTRPPTVATVGGRRGHIRRIITVVIRGVPHALLTDIRRMTRMATPVVRGHTRTAAPEAGHILMVADGDQGAAADIDLIPVRTRGAGPVIRDRTRAANHIAAQVDHAITIDTESLF